MFAFVVKDYQLIQSQDSCTVGLPGQPEGHGCPKTLLSRYLGNFTSIISHLLQTSQDNGSSDAVEASWVLSLALKGLYNILKVLQPYPALHVGQFFYQQAIPDLFNMISMLTSDL